ncbi:hypothetical protein HK105_201040 [Polyrhizophydium stewartii]|uniref:Uncharacterized protein n=1 Tax=Polyrhizophydium stewartii TaxID=2732419 RepID=A0ABR4NIW1_9FUNG
MSLLDDPFESLSLSPAETAAYAKLFKLADAKGDGIILPQAAVVFLSKSRLSQETLGQIWTIANSENLGFLNAASFSRALKLIAAAQAGLPVAKSSLSAQTPLPQFEGIQLDAAPKPAPAATPLAVHLTGGRLPVHRTGDSFVSQQAHAPVTITDEERERFTTFFNNAGPVNESLSADVARDLFLKSQLPVETLGKIWSLVDPAGTGRLPLTQFIVAMALITKLRTKALAALPPVVPPELLKSASGFPASTPAAGLASPGPSRPGGGFWDNHQFGTDSTMARSKPDLPALTAQRTGTLSSSDRLAAVTTDDEKKQFYGFFDQLDSQKQGFLTGEVASVFFLKSNLPPSDLAQIWNLVDVGATGRITRDGFAAAMSLIRKRMAGAPIPASLAVPAATPAAPKTASLLDPVDPFDPLGGSAAGPSIPAPALAPKPVADLFSFDSAPSPAPLPSTQGGLAAPGSTTALNSVPGLGASISGLGASASSFTIPTLPAAMSMYAEAAEREADLAARKEEVKRLTEQLKLLHPTADELKAKHAEIDAEYKAITDEKNKLTIQLSQLRATYDAEVQIVRESQQMLVTEKMRLDAARLELSQIEDAVAAVKQEKTTLLDMTQSLQHELTEAKKSIQERTDETNAMRAELEKVRADVRQQQQLADVNQKLLASAQAENQRFKMDLIQERERLEHARQKSAQLQQQASVMQAINQRERDNIKAAEQERLREMSRSEELLSKMAPPAASPTPGPLSPSKSVQLDAAGLTLQLPLSPPPPVPSLASKPVKGESLASIQAEPTAALPPVDTETAAEAARVMSPAPASAPLSAPLSSSSAVPAVAPSPTPSQGRPELVKRMSRDELNAKDKNELDSLFEANKPKSRPDSTKASPAKATASLRSNSVHTLDSAAPPLPQTALSPALSQASAPAAAPSVAASASSAVPAASAFPANFEDAFGSVPALPSTPAATQGPPKPPTTPSSKSSIARKTAAGTLEFESEFQKAFSSADKSATAARDSSTIRSASTHAHDQSFAKIQPKDFGADAFTFDASFGDAKPAKVGSVSAKVDFDAAFASSFGSPKPAPASASAGPAKTSAPAGFGSVDFASAFGSDPFGAPAAAPAGAAAAPAPSAAFDAFFGCAPPAAPSSGNPFGSADFDKAFAMPAPALAPAPGAASAPAPSAAATAGAAPSGTAEAPEVDKIVQMGFTREQALNALDIHSYDVNRAINYLLESA